MEENGYWSPEKAEAVGEDGDLRKRLLCHSRMLFSYGWHHVLSEAGGHSMLVVTTFLPCLSQAHLPNTTGYLPRQEQHQHRL